MDSRDGRCVRFRPAAAPRRRHLSRHTPRHALGAPCSHTTASCTDERMGCVCCVCCAGDRIADITVARNLKEKGCEAYPTSLRELVGASGPHGVNLNALFSMPDPSIERVRLGAVEFDLGWERFLPAELFFEQDDESLDRLILQSIDATVALETSGAIDRTLAEGVKTDENAAVAAALTGTGTGTGTGSSAAASCSPQTASGAPELRRQPSRPVGSLREALLGRIVLSGGSSQIKGLPQRLAHEIGEVVAKGDSGISKASVKVRPSIDGDATTWIGASVLAGTSTFAEHWCVHAPTSSQHPYHEWMEGDKDEDDDDEEEEDEEEDDDDDEDDDDEEEDDDDDEEEANDEGEEVH